jgi:hypothetical protein
MPGDPHTPGAAAAQQRRNQRFKPSTGPQLEAEGRQVGLHPGQPERAVMLRVEERPHSLRGVDGSRALRKPRRWSPQ